jgi:hypothetical protein
MIHYPQTHFEVFFGKIITISGVSVLFVPNGPEESKPLTFVCRFRGIRVAKVHTLWMILDRRGSPFGYWSVKWNEEHVVDSLPL